MQGKGVCLSGASITYAGNVSRPSVGLQADEQQLLLSAAADVMVG